MKPKRGCTPFRRSSHLSHTLSVCGLDIGLSSLCFSHLEAYQKWKLLRRTLVHHFTYPASIRQDTLSRGRKASEIQRTPIYARYLSTCQSRYPLRIYNWMWQMDATCFTHNDLQYLSIFLFIWKLHYCLLQGAPPWWIMIDPYLFFRTKILGSNWA